MMKTDLEETRVEGVPDVAGEGGADGTDAGAPGGQPCPASTRARSVSISIRALLVGVVIAGLAVAVGAMTWLYLGADAKLADQARMSGDSSHAEQVALDYAVSAAVMDYKDLGAWKQNLVKGTTPELKTKLTDAATAMEQLVAPLQWTSTAEPLAAKVRSNTNGVYVVDAFVNVMTKTAQAGDGVQSTAMYSVTVDGSNGWQISNVGGIGTVVGDK